MAVARLFRLLLHRADDRRANSMSQFFYKNWDALASSWLFRRFKSRTLWNLALLLYLEPTARCGEILTLNAGCRLATTRDKRLLLTPHTCRPGDKILLLGGGRFPFVVRDGAGCQKTFVGPCYASRDEMIAIRELWSAREAKDMAFV